MYRPRAGTNKNCQHKVALLIFLLYRAGVQTDSAALPQTAKLKNLVINMPTVCTCVLS
jgi:hypothetical protein